MRGSCLGKGPVLVTAEGEWQWVRQVGRGEEEEGGGIAPPPPQKTAFPEVQREEECFPFVSQSCASSGKARPLQLWSCEQVRRKIWATGPKFQKHHWERV